MLAKTVVAPIDRIKILYQVTATPFRLRDVPHVARQIVKTEGVAALWKGNIATMIRVFPYAGIQFMVFNRLKSHFIESHGHGHAHGHGYGHGHGHAHGHGHGDDEHKPLQGIINNTPTPNDIDPNGLKWGMTTMESFFAGSVAGAVSVLCTYPLDLTRAQLAVLKKQEGKRHKGFVVVLGDNYRNGAGVQGLFRGITPTLLGMLPYAGVAFAINEQAKRQVRNVMYLLCCAEIVHCAFIISLCSFKTERN